MLIQRVKNKLVHSYAHMSGHYKNCLQKNPNTQTALTLLYLRYKGNLIYTHIMKNASTHTHTHTHTPILKPQELYMAVICFYLDKTPQAQSCKWSIPTTAQAINTSLCLAAILDPYHGNNRPWLSFYTVQIYIHLHGFRGLMVESS